MIPELSSALTHWPAVTASFVAAGAVLADAQTDAKGWEDLGLKGALVSAVIFLVRYVVTQNREHREEMNKLHTEHRETLKGTVETASQVSQGLRASIDRMYDFFETFVKDRLEK